MKTKLFLAAVFTLFISFAFANNTEPTKNEQIRLEVTKLISKLDWEGDQSFTVTFLLSPKNEIIVTSTSDKAIDSIVKSHLNYKKLKLSFETRSSELYTIPIRVTKK